MARHLERLSNTTKRRRKNTRKTRKTKSGNKTKTKTKQQVRLLLSVVSPLTKKEKAKLIRELKSGKVKVRNRS